MMSESVEDSFVSSKNNERERETRGIDGAKIVSASEPRAEAAAPPV